MNSENRRLLNLVKLVSRMTASIVWNIPMERKDAPFFTKHIASLKCVTFMIKGMISDE